MKIDINTFKKSRTWVIIVPAVLFIWTFYITLNFFSVRDQFDRKFKSTVEITQKAHRIAERITLAGGTDSANSQIGDFDYLTSALQCARAAAIDKTKLSRGLSSAPKKLKGNTYQHHENYKLTGVYMFQIAKFIDYAERNFASLTCSQISIVPSLNRKNRDSWDVTLDFKYPKKGI